ncbi:ABC-type antimicrobial peptide transport system, permease component [Lactococcus cremoris subsp. cremoris SK11]|uniref:ABC-type antimicrobial peptide transport system, permease component n=2 Tax=Lactococcus lactis subsp. cremoris TaxID=1359 RepID=Q02Z84_LACLS|nr:ABC transporter permease [Lactococcus cremoris]ABJ72738.1 ABC-type antimicrobial peptide transport system, permease component [Lactococcus cremoris subsp. cremoris SK11]ARE23344.1 FtsX-like permease family protein [Lactococcus cremoris]KZK50040.1 ABC transporter permease protein [Lactococcus cremoris]KZK50814.1 ABC transporter permease protein [Lactococcus cremoris]MCT4408332.1 ABC transporter permease [Lactococcus cremoris]
MRKKTLNKEIRRSITGSLGRFISIFSLMLLGTFAFVGLKVSGPDMRATAEEFYRQHQLADLTVTSTLGLDETDQRLINETKGLKKAEFGYFQDLVIKVKESSLRLFSKPDELSTYELMSGKLPQSNSEIALDYLYDSQYKIGQSIDFTPPKSEDSDLLKNHSFKIVGFVKSSEYVDKSNFGATTVGTGKLNGYGLVTKDAFDSKVYMIARLSYKNLQNISIFDDKYDNRLKREQKALENTFKNQPEKRLAALKVDPEKQIIEAKSQISHEESQLKQQENQLIAQKNQIGESSSAQTIEQLNGAQNQIDAGKEKLASAKAELAKKEAALNQLEEPTYQINNRKEGNPGYKTFLEDSTRIDSLSNIFPVVLFAIALLVSLTTMTRFVEEERGNLGLLKALGYSNREIRKKFMVYGLVSSGLGALVGTIIGHTFLPLAVFNAYTASSTFSNLRLTFSPLWTIVAFAIAIACSLLPAYWVVRKELKEVPASLFLAKVPKAGSRILLEKIDFIWKRMSFTYKVTARNLFRYKKRMLMTIFGVAGCTALLVMGFGIRDSISGLASKQFGQILHYDMIAIEKNKVSDKEKEASGKLEKQEVSLIATNQSDDLSKYVSLESRKNNQKIVLNDSGAVISEKFAELLGLKVGDSLTLKDDENKPVRIKVSAITEMYMGHYIFMNQSVYQKVFKKDFMTNGQLIKLKNASVNNIQKMSAQLMQEDGIQAISQNSDLKKVIESFMYGINSVMIVLITCAILLAIVVIYNLTNINVSERIRELATIKVLGFYDREVTLYIYRETILLSFLGILVGFGLGDYFHQVIMNQLSADQIMFAPGLLWTNLLLSAAITFATTLLLALVVHFKLKAVDMLGALKSVD